MISPVGEAYYLPSADYVEVEVGGTTCNHSVSDYTVSGGLKVIASTIGTSGQVVFPNGVSVSSNTGTDIGTDPFGNTISIAFNRPTVTYTDTLGNNTFVVTAGSGSTGEIDTYENTGATTRQIKQILTLETAKTTFGCSQWPDQTITGRYATTEIDYPDGNNLYLSYESVTGGITGRIHQVTYRTGGTATYTYGTMNCQSMIPSSLSRQTVDGTTTYTFALNGTHGTTTTVLDPGKNKTVFSFQGTDSAGLPQFGVPLTLTQVQVWRNTGSVTTPAYPASANRTVLYCYNGNTSACATTQASYPITAKDVYVTLDGKSTSSRTKSTFDTYGNVTEIDRYPFTTVGTGTIDNKTVITYGTWNGSSCVAVGSNIVNLPCEVKTTDGGGTHTLSDARYTYSSKGFQTQVQQWTNANGWKTMGSASPNTNGAPASITNALGHGVTFTYTSGCNSILPTGTSETINSVTMTTGATWDCNMGKLLTSTDVNGNTAHFTYDLLGRPASQEDPANVYTLTETYPTGTSEQITDSTYFTTIKTVDALGRPARKQTTDGASYDTVTQFYSFNIGPNFYVETTEPCSTTLGSDCPLSGSPAYNHYNFMDPLGRSISKSTNNNEVYTSTYSQNDVSVTLSPNPSGENNKVVQTEYDGLGRPISTCALQATGGTACGQFDGNSGILTSFSYSYSAGGVTTTATRGSQSHTTFVDQLGRVKSFTLPESGTTTNYYDVSGNCSGDVASTGNLTCSVDQAAKQTIYIYDSMNRLVATNTSSGVGPCRRFVYDVAGNGIYTAPTGYSATNAKGRLVEAATDDCTFPYSQAHMITDEWFAYDADGRTTDVYQTSAHSGGFYHTTAGYAVNGQLTSISGVPGKSTYTIGLDSNGRPDTSTYGVTAVATNVNYNAAGQTTEIDYGATDKDVYTYDPYTELMNRFTFTLDTTSLVGTPTWNANRTLKQLAIADGFNATNTQTCNFNPTDHTGTGYDDVGRLVGVYCANGGTVLWTQTYGYDQYDNFSKTGTTSWNPTYDAATNHMLGGATYDADGQVTYDRNNSFAWDGYHKMSAAEAGASLGSCGGAGVFCYTYDALGRMVEKNNAGTFTQYLYSPAGLTAIMSGQTANAFRAPIP